MPETFRDRVVVITGGAGGIGRALAARFLKSGARVAALDLDEASLAELAEGTASDRLMTLKVDITDESATRAALKEVTERFGGVDVLVNNAGLVHRSSFKDTEANVFRRVMEVNYFGSIHVTKAALPSLVERRGMIVVISSVAGLVPLFGRSGYSASKHALHGLFESLRAELADDGVGVLMVCPSFTTTPFEGRALGAHGERVARPRSKVGKEATPESVADAIHDATLARKKLVVLSPVGKVAVWLSRIAPGMYQRSMTRSLKSELT